MNAPWQVAWECVSYRDRPHPIPCTAGGTYAPKDSGGPAEKHTKLTNHPTDSRWLRPEEAAA